MTVCKSLQLIFLLYVEMKSLAAVIVFLFYIQCLPKSNGQQMFVIDGRDVDISDAPYMVTTKYILGIRSINFLLYSFHSDV